MAVPQNWYLWLYNNIDTLLWHAMRCLYIDFVCFVKYILSIFFFSERLLTVFSKCCCICIVHIVCCTCTRIPFLINILSFYCHPITHRAKNTWLNLNIFTLGSPAEDNQAQQYFPRCSIYRSLGDNGTICHCQVYCSR